MADCAELIKRFDAVLPFERGLRTRTEWDSAIATRDYTVRRLCSTKPKLGAMLSFVEGVKRDAGAKPETIWLSDCVTQLILACTSTLKQQKGGKQTLMRAKRDESCVEKAHEWFMEMQKSSGSLVARGAPIETRDAGRPGTAAAFKRQGNRPQSATVRMKQEMGKPALARPRVRDRIVKLRPSSASRAIEKPETNAAEDILRGFLRPNLYRSHANRLKRNASALGPDADAGRIKQLEALASEIDVLSQPPRRKHPQIVKRAWGDLAPEQEHSEEDSEDGVAMSWLNNMWRAKRERELKETRRKEDVKKALEKWEKTRMELEERARARRRNRVRGARLALENRLHQQAALKGGRPETAPQLQTQSIDEPVLPLGGLLPTASIASSPEDDDGEVASKPSKPSCFDEGDEEGILNINATSLTEQQPPMHFGTPVPSTMARPSFESSQDGAARPGFGKVVDVSNVDVVRAGIKGMKLLRAQRSNSTAAREHGPEALLVPEDSRASETASKMFHDEDGEVEVTFGADDLRSLLHEAQIHEVEAIRLAFQKAGLTPPTKALERALVVPRPGYHTLELKTKRGGTKTVVPMPRIGENLPVNPLLEEKLALFGNLVAKKGKKKKKRKKKGSKRKKKGAAKRRGKRRVGTKRKKKKGKKKKKKKK